MARFVQGNTTFRVINIVVNVAETRTTRFCIFITDIYTFYLDIYLLKLILDLISEEFNNFVLKLRNIWITLMIYA